MFTRDKSKHCCGFALASKSGGLSGATAWHRSLSVRLLHLSLKVFFLGFFMLLCHCWYSSVPSTQRYSVTVEEAHQENHEFNNSCAAGQRLIAYPPDTQPFIVGYETSWAVQKKADQECPSVTRITRGLLHFFPIPEGKSMKGLIL